MSMAATMDGIKLLVICDQMLIFSEVNAALVLAPC